jgi:hypothetical protein
VPLEIAAGTAVITSDVLLHRSGANGSRHMRRAWMPQFAAGPLTWSADGCCVALAIPVRLEKSGVAFSGACSGKPLGWQQQPLQ